MKTAMAFARRQEKALPCGRMEQNGWCGALQPAVQPAQPWQAGLQSRLMALALSPPSATCAGPCGCRGAGNGCGARLQRPPVAHV
jgi:hypothetical protein